MRVRAHRSLSHRRLWLAVALWAVVALQSLGLVHGVSHAHQGRVALMGEGAAHAPSGWGHALGSLACEQLDQLAHGAAPPTLPTALVHHVLAQSPALPPVGPVPEASSPRPYQARAPPLG